MATEEDCDDEQIILIVGSVGLDRLLTVSKFPTPDSKVRSQSYYEVGGGNAANTASAIGLLENASFLNRKIRVKFLSKIGDDDVGTQLEKELRTSNVDTSSNLFQKGPLGSTTAFTTILVDLEGHTRTCIHTPGTSGELSAKDVESQNMDQVFQNVIHLHSDSRHTSASLLLAQEAKKRNIPVSVDCEKDRKNTNFDSLIEIADIIFTNSNCLGDYLQRLELDLEAKEGRTHLPDATISTNLDKQVTGERNITNVYTKSLGPSAFFTRWYSDMKKQVIVTQGDMGALHFQLLSIFIEPVTTDDVECSNKINLEFKKEEEDSVRIHHQFLDCIKGEMVLHKTEYKVQNVGVLKDVIIEDTTGAGDAFIGGYLMAKYGTPKIKDSVEFALQFGSWVGGKKLEGPGARSALPTGIIVDESLGTDAEIVQAEMEKLLSKFASD